MYLRAALQYPSCKIEVLRFCFCYFTDFDFQFPTQDGPLTDFVYILGMPSLTQFTVCFSMKAGPGGQKGTPFSYAVPGSNNELLIYNYKNFQLFIGGEVR